MVRVLHSGFYTSIQDLGRKDYQHLGVPISGAMDLEAAKLANAILDNNEHCAVLEMTMVGPKLEFTCNSTVSVTGANLSPTLNGVRINNYLAINVNKGDVIEFGSLTKGLRSYLAVSSGFQTALVLNSRSMYKGITQTTLLQKGDMLTIKPESFISNKNATVRPNTDYMENHIIQVYKGPEFYKLNEIQISSLFDKDFTIAKENNRMAYQLNELIENNLKDIITSLVLPGTVQLTPSGKLIVLMRDCQTTGGYPRVLQLSEISINNLAQKFVGNKIKFRLMS